ncbi:inner membrane protein, LrgB family protein [Legionella sainthelensi]|uniref:Inner membrane protein, LrgB family protein n=1 Tax=Legionella sainthelensi TaxID=28087 RepID=A0A0W0YE84_9GAMM|nr:LrgB family protein [Legionella sainthelensi]KTD55272.1 inner membrane protein, LrgB family protein [Legionella sainthelensi]VEH37315.1 inner membrane protein, LrgB family protein [Legionella sainthelensi]
MPSHILSEPVIQALFWSTLTITIYYISKKLYNKWPFWWLMPLTFAPLILASLVSLLDVNYQDYLSGTRWLVQLIGPATVAFAIPIYEQHALIRQHWPILLIGVIAGSITSLSSSWLLASLIGLDEQIRLSLIPHSISTPFALEASRSIGAPAELTALFVVITGILGAIIGDILLKYVSCHSSLAKGALFGAGAHSAGTAQARKIGNTEGAIASLVMILSGLFNIILLPFMNHVLMRG